MWAYSQTSLWGGAGGEGQTEVSEFNRKTNLSVAGSGISSDMVSGGNNLTLHNRQTSPWRSWKMCPSRRGDVGGADVSKAQDCGPRLCGSATVLPRKGSKNARGERSRARQHARCPRMESTECLGCWRVTLRYFCRALAREGKTAWAASWASMGRAPPLPLPQFLTRLTWAKASSAADSRRALRLRTLLSYSCSS